MSLRETVNALLQPLDEHTPYTLDRARERGRDLLCLYADAAADRPVAQILVEHARQSFWAHLALFSWTTDSLSEIHRKPFNPAFYVRLISDWADERTDDGRWVRPTLLFPKSRQVMLSWWAMARLDWAAQRFAGSEIPVVAKNEENAKRILRRIRDLHDGIDAFAPWYRRESGAMPAKRRRGAKAPSETRIDYANGSYVVALAEGGEQVRSMVAPMQLYDEAAFQPHFRENLGSALAFRGRGQVLCVSSANPSYFAELTHDRLDGSNGGVESEFYVSPASMSLPESGSNDAAIRLWRTRAGKVDVAKIFYFADPSYRSAQAVADRRAGKSRDQYEREDLINDEVRAGRRIFPMLDRAAHVCGPIRVFRWPESKTGWAMAIAGRRDANGALRVSPVRLIRAVDHGTTNFCAAVWFAIDGEGDWFAYRAYKETGRGVSANALGIADAGEKQLTPRESIYAADVIDAMQGMPDGRGRIEDLYREFKIRRAGPDGEERWFHPFADVAAVEKGGGSRQEGLDLIGSMLLSTLVAERPDSPWWDECGYPEDWKRSFARHSRLYIGPDAMALFEEMDAARYDERPGGDPSMNQPETSVDMKDDALDCARYALKAGRIWVKLDRPTVDELVEAEMECA